MQSSIIVLFE